MCVFAANFSALSVRFLVFSAINCAASAFSGDTSYNVNIFAVFEEIYAKNRCIFVPVCGNLRFCMGGVSSGRVSFPEAVFEYIFDKFFENLLMSSSGMMLRAL